MSSSDTSASVRLTGRVKWFNNKTGFGFITIVGGNEQFRDASEIFAHHSAIKVSQEQYRYLVEGEYVEFSVSNTASGDHKFQAADVRGVKGGKLFCETRHEQRSASATTNADAGATQVRSGDRPVRGRQTTRGGGRGRGEWMLVRKDTSEYRSGSGGRGGSRVYSSRPTGQRQPRHNDSSVEESHYQPRSKSAPAPAPEPMPAVTSTPSPAPTPVTPPASTSQPSQVPATPRAASARKPKQSKPSS